MKSKTRIKVLVSNYVSHDKRHEKFMENRRKEIRSMLDKLKTEDESAYNDLLLELPDAVTGGFSGTVE